MNAICAFLAGTSVLCGAGERGDDFVRLGDSAQKLAIASQCWHGGNGAIKSNLRKVAKWKFF